jgi:hypothetical protein
VGDTTGTDPGNLATGASVTATGTTDIIANEGLYIYGVEFYSSDDILIGNTSADHDIFLESCRLELTGAVSGDDIVLGAASSNLSDKITLLNCALDFGAASQSISPRHGQTSIIGGAVEFDLTVLIENPSTNTHAGPLVFRGVDLSALVSANLVTGSAANAERLIIFSRCLLGSGTGIVTGTIDVAGFRVESYHCQSGTDSDPAFQLEVHTKEGTITADTSRYRTGGAKDSERTNPIAWDMDTTVHSARGYPGHALVSPPITAWTDGDASTAHTYRIAIASDATIQDDEFWIELEGPNDAATDSKAVFQTSRVAPRTTAAALTTDASSSWTGSGVGTKQYAEVSYTPDKPGPISVRCYMAKASDNIYVDPKIQIDP